MVVVFPCHTHSYIPEFRILSLMFNRKLSSKSLIGQIIVHVYFVKAKFSF